MRYYRPDQKPYIVAAHDLPLTSLSRALDPYVANSLSLVPVYGHPALEPKLMQALFEHLHHNKRLAPPSPSAKTDASPPRIIRQQRPDGAAYYGQWFNVPTTSTPTIPLPGRWTTVYPLSEAGSPTEISDSRGWVRLQEPTHTLLLQQLRHVDAQQQQQHQYALVCRLYRHWEQQIENHLSREVRIRWHTTLADTAATYPYALVIKATIDPLLPPDAIAQGYKALICAEQLADDRIAATKINRRLDDLVQARMKMLLQPLLADYQQQWAAALAPLQQPTGKLNLTDFQALCSLAPRLLPQLLWLDATSAEQAYANLKVACNQRQDDIITQLQALVNLKDPTPAEQQALQDWRRTLQNLLTLWRDYGNGAIAATWRLTLNQVLPPTQSLPEEASLQQRILADMEQGFKRLQPADSLSPTLPAIWEQMHQQTLTILTRYAALGQTQAFQQLKQHYGLRLRSYQQACIVLSQADPRYSTLANWLQRSDMELRILSSPLLSTQAPPPLPWPWQSLRETPSNPAQLFSQMCERIHQQLLIPPCAFDIVACMPPTKEEPRQLYVLIPAHAKIDYSQHPYFLAYQRLFMLYQQLLSEIYVPWKIDIATPNTLAGRLCPLVTPQVTPSLPLHGLVWQQRYTCENTPETTVQSTPLFSALLQQLLRRLQLVATQTQAEEQRLREQYHALPTQTLLSPKIKNTGVALQRRLTALREIHTLWRTREQYYVPLVTFLATVAATHPQAFAIEPSTTAVNPDEEKDEKESKKTTPMTTPVQTEIHLAIYRQLPRLWKPCYWEQLQRQWQAAATLKLQESKHTLSPKTKMPFSSTSIADPSLLEEQQILLKTLSEDADSSGWCYRQEQEVNIWQQATAQLFAMPTSTIQLPIAISHDDLQEVKVINQTSQLKKTPETKSTSIAFPPVLLRYAEHGEIRQGELSDVIVQQLLDDKYPARGQWRPKAKGVGGRHHVLRVVIPASKKSSEMVIWFKFNPEQPGAEHLAQRIDQCLGGFATPSQQLVQIIIGNQPPIPVLLSLEVAPPTPEPKDDANLAQVLMHRPDILEKLSPYSFVSTLLRVLALQPEDDKSNDYFLVPDPDKPGFYRLVHIDNERLFFTPLQAGKGWFAKAELNVKTIIFCLQHMEFQWQDLIKEDHRLISYREQILRLSTANCFQRLLCEASDLHDQWCVLFSEDQAVELAQNALARKEIIAPLMLIPLECEKAFLERLHLIQQIWLHGGTNGFSLLGGVQPTLLAEYQPLFQLSNNALERFALGPGKWYQRDTAGRSQTSVSGMASLSRQFQWQALLALENLNLQQAILGDWIRQAWRREQASPAQALRAIGIWQQKRILQIERDLWMLPGNVVEVGEPTVSSKETKDKSSPTKLPASYQRVSTQDATARRQHAQLQLSLLPIADRTTLMLNLGKLFAAGTPREAEARQTIATTMLAALTQTPVSSLSLAPFYATLTDKELVAIIQCSGSQLLSLDISDCNSLPPTILALISKHCPNLGHLKARHLRWETVSLGTGLSQLARLDLSSSAIRQLNLPDLPQLTSLKLRRCLKLSILANSHKEGFISPQIVMTPYALPKLQQLDIRDCVGLTDIQILIPRPLEPSQCQWTGCKPNVIVNWLKMIVTQNKKVDAADAFFAKVTQAITSKYLELSAYLTKTEDEWLYLLLNWNLPIKRLTIKEVKVTPEEKSSSTGKSEQKSTPTEKNIPLGKITPTERNTKFDYQRKIILLGSGASGKSALLKRFVDGSFLAGMPATVMVK